jgi:hypothetical protein
MGKLILIRLSCRSSLDPAGWDQMTRPVQEPFDFAFQGLNRDRRSARDRCMRCCDDTA